MGIKKRLTALSMALVLSFSSCAVDVLEVQALEWVTAAVGIEEALSFLLGVLGIAYVGSKAEDVDWVTIKDNCIDFQIQQGQSSVAVSNWWADVIRGKLDTASECWQSFKDWASTLGQSSGGGVSISDPLSCISSIVPSINSYRIVSNSLGVSYDDLEFTKALYSHNSNGYVFYFLIGNSSVSVNNNGVLFNSRDGVLYTNLLNSSAVSANFYINKDNHSLAYNSSQEIYLYNIDFSVVSSYLHIWDLSPSAVNPDWAGIQDNVSGLEVAPDIATDLPYTGVIDIPWDDIADRVGELVGENITDLQSDFAAAWEKLLDRVQSGTMTLNEYATYVQNISNTFVYEGDTFFPNGNGEGEDEQSPEDKVQDNANRGAFALAGLEKVFPFCIPWDIVAFLTLLEAEPVAPVIEYPIYNPVTDSEEVITIDFSLWEQQVIIMRYIFDFLLIIGLLLLARGLIGAGGSD